MTIGWRVWAASATLVALAATVTPVEALEVAGYGAGAVTWVVAGFFWQVEEGGPDGGVQTRPWMAVVALVAGWALLFGAWVFTYLPMEVVLVLLAAAFCTFMGVAWTRLTR